MPDNDVWAKIEIQQGDITKLAVDGIVNAANSRLVGGSGVDGAIHQAAGPELCAACRELGGCQTGHAKITLGFKLPAQYIIHAVGPVYHGGHGGEPELLAACYKHSLELVVEQGLKSVAFSAISTGIYSYPFEAATRIALKTTFDFLADHAEIEKAIFIFFSKNHFEQAQEIFAELSSQ
ncbi:MAG: O-acetyl-ADP-ribose deacetylase [Planctomycetota bacterium]